MPMVSGLGSSKVYRVQRAKVKAYGHPEKGPKGTTATSLPFVSEKHQKSRFSSSKPYRVNLNRGWCHDSDHQTAEKTPQMPISFIPNQKSVLVQSSADFTMKQGRHQG